MHIKLSKPTLPETYDTTGLSYAHTKGQMDEMVHGANWGGSCHKNSLQQGMAVQETAERDRKKRQQGELIPGDDSVRDGSKRW